LPRQHFEAVVGVAKQIKQRAGWGHRERWVLTHDASEKRGSAPWQSAQEEYLFHQKQRNNYKEYHKIYHLQDHYFGNTIIHNDIEDHYHHLMNYLDV
jgi:hypothetical protein